VIADELMKRPVRGFTSSLRESSRLVKHGRDVGLADDERPRTPVFVEVCVKRPWSVK